MRIGFVTTSYPHAGDGVAGAFVRAMARALVRRGHRVRVVCAAREDDHAQVDPGVEVVAVGGAGLFYGGGAPERLAAGGARAWAGAARFAAVLAARAWGELRECEGLVSHFALPCAAVAGAVRRRRPHVAVVHGTDGVWLARAPARAQRAVLAGATAVRFSHSGLRGALAAGAVDERTQRVVVAPMGFDPAPALSAERRAQVRRAAGASASELLAVAVARLVPVKGLDVLVDAAARAAREGVALKVVIAGEGPERERLERAIAQSGAPVRLAGAVGASARDELLGAADVFVASARELGDGRTEGAPTAVVEALGAGLPVVAARAGGLAELVGDAGVLAAAGDARELARALARVARDGAQRARWSERAAARAAGWTWDADAARVESVLAR